MSLQTIYSASVVAFALVTLQACAPAATTTSRVREPGNGALPALGALQPDEAPRAEPRHSSDRNLAERASARAGARHVTRR